MYHLPLKESHREHVTPLWHAGSIWFIGSSDYVYKILQGYELPVQKGMRAKAAEDMYTLENEHTGEQRGPEVMPTKQQSQIPTAQLLAFEQVLGIRHTIAACVCCCSQIYSQLEGVYLQVVAAPCGCQQDDHNVELLTQAYRCHQEGRNWSKLACPSTY